MNGDHAGICCCHLVTRAAVGTEKPWTTRTAIEMFGLRVRQIPPGPRDSDGVMCITDC